jgi:hypothetical protein
MSYIKELEKQIYWFHIQEQCTPDVIVAPARSFGPVEWPRAIKMYEEGLEGRWRAVAEAHAGRKLPQPEFVSTYGEWSDRHTPPGDALLRLIRKDCPAESSGE